MTTKRSDKSIKDQLEAAGWTLGPLPPTSSDTWTCVHPQHGTKSVEMAFREVQKVNMRLDAEDEMFLRLRRHAWEIFAQGAISSRHQSQTPEGVAIDAAQVADNLLIEWQKRWASKGDGK